MAAMRQQQVRASCTSCGGSATALRTCVPPFPGPRLFRVSDRTVPPSSDTIATSRLGVGRKQARAAERLESAWRCRAGIDTAEAGPASREGEVLLALSRIIDPDFGMDIVACGFVKDMAIDSGSGAVSFRLELTTPACPIKDEFERKAREYVGALPWVTSVQLAMSAQPPRPLVPEADRPFGLRSVTHVIAVSSCKGGVGKSTTAVNLAYTLAQMGARVGIFDADIYGPSLPTMISPEIRVLKMDPETRAISPVEYEGVKAVSFGYAGQGSAIMRGPMVSGVINQLLTATEWGELDYLVVDFPPGTGDIQLTLCQTVGFSAAVIVTTPQKLAFIDVAKGIRMFARLQVPCVAVVENMSYFDGDDGKRYYPFGSGSGDRIVRDFGLRNLVRFPIVPSLSAAGDGGRPLVVEDPTCATASAFMELSAAVVQEIAKLKLIAKNAVRFDAELAAFAVVLPTSSAAPIAQSTEPVGDTESDPLSSSADSSDGQRVSVPNRVVEFYLDPALVRRADTSAASVNEWTGERMARDADVSDDVRPASVAPLGNYAVQILWEDGFNQVAAFDLLEGLKRLTRPELEQRRQQQQQRVATQAAATSSGDGVEGEKPALGSAAQILAGAVSR